MFLHIHVTNLKFYQKKNITLFRMRLQFLDKSQASIIASYKEFFTELNRKAIKLRVCAGRRKDQRPGRHRAQWWLRRGQPANPSRA